MSNKIGELVLKAKGNRSYREYQNDSGVDAAVISKIVKGTYIPQKAETYKKLASCADNDVTFEELIDAANNSKEFNSGFTAGIEAALPTLGLAGSAAMAMAMIPALGAPFVGTLAMSLIKSKRKDQDIENAKAHITNAKRFCALSDKIILSQFAFGGAAIQLSEDKADTPFCSELDTCFLVNSRVYTELIIRHLYFEGSESKKLIEGTTKLSIAECVFSKSKKTRNIAIVTKSDAAYYFLKEAAGELSYKGNIIAVLIDEINFELKQQVVLSTFDDSVNSTELAIM